MEINLEANLFEHFFPSNNPSILTFMLATFFLSGIVKGFLGIGLPAAAMALLTLILEPTHAIALLVLPILITNLSQFFRSNHRMESFQNYWPMGMTILISIFITSLFMASYPSELLTISIGTAMVVYALNGLVGLKLKIKNGKFLQIIFGMISGILGGLSSIWSPPVAMYLIARGIDKERFISASGFLFLVGAAPFAIGLYIGKVLTLQIITQSTFGLLFVLLGFYFGEGLRKRITQNWFEKALLIAFCIMGIRLIAVGLF